MPHMPAHREDTIDLQQGLCTTKNKVSFLVYDSGVGSKERILIFASQGALYFLTVSEHWYAYGTLKVSPVIFFQLCTIHGLRDGRSFPCMFSLLPNINENTYNRLLEQLF